MEGSGEGGGGSKGKKGSRGKEKQGRSGEDFEWQMELDDWGHLYDKSNLCQEINELVEGLNPNRGRSYEQNKGCFKKYQGD